MENEKNLPEKYEEIDITRLTLTQKKKLFQDLREERDIQEKEQIKNEIRLIKQIQIKGQIEQKERLDGIQEGVDKIINKQGRIQDHIQSKTYLIRSNLGQELVNPAISAQRTTKILRMIEILKMNSDIPHMLYTEGYNPIAQKYKITMNSGFEKFDYKYNVDKVKNKFEKWLLKNDLFNDFFACETKKELDQFIDNLYDNFMNNKIDD